MKKAIAITLCMVITILSAVFVFATGEDTSKVSCFEEQGGSYGIQTIEQTEQGVQMSGTKNPANVYNFRYTYKENLPVLTDGLDLLFSVDSVNTTVNDANLNWLMIGLMNEGGIGGWGPQGKQGIITAFRFNNSDFLTSLSYNDGYPIHSLQNVGTTYSAQPTDYHLTIKKVGDNFEVKVNDVLVGTHSAAADKFAWLTSQTFVNGGYLSFSFFNSTDDITTPATITIKEINGVKMVSEAVVTPEEPTVAPEEPTVTPEEPTIAPEEPTVAPEEPTVTPEEPIVTPVAEEPFINGTALAIATQSKQLTEKGYVFSGTVGNTQNYAFSYNKKIDLAEDGLKLVMSFDEYAPANQFFTITLTDIQGWNGWNNSNPNKGLALVIRPVDSFIEIHELTGNTWPTHVGDVTRDFEIVKGTPVTFEIKKSGDYLKFYINGVEMTQFKDSRYDLLNKYLSDGAYVTLSSLNFNENKNLTATATVQSLNEDVFATEVAVTNSATPTTAGNSTDTENSNTDESNPTTGDSSIWMISFLALVVVSYGVLAGFRRKNVKE